METFLVRISPAETAPQGSLVDAASRVLQALPRFDVPFQLNSGAWSSPEGGLRLEWAASTPQSGFTTVVVQEDQRGLLLLWGELFEGDEAAEVVWAAYERGGIEAVHELDGCFSAVIASSKGPTVEVCSDLIGQRALRATELAGATLLSPHDACLVAAGLPISFDEVSQASCFLVQHSLRAMPLLRNVVGLEGNEVLTFKGLAAPERRRLPKIIFSPRIDVADPRAQQACREWVADRLIETTKKWALSGTHLRCELTAGLDSRATLACLVGARAQRYVETVTGGGRDSLDVTTAIRLAKLANVRHKVVEESQANPEQFLQHATLRAFATNGETEAKRALAPLPKWNPEGTIRVGGASSEVFRGFFYPCMGPAGIAPRNFERVIQLLVARRMRDFDALPLASEDTRAQLRRRLNDCFEEYSMLSSDGNDALDLFYLFERCAHWSAHVQRATWNRTRNPLMVPSAVRALYRLPPPLGHHVGIHAYLIQRYFPESRWVLLNGARPLDLEGPEAWKTRTRFVLNAGRARFDRLAYRYLGVRKPKATAQNEHFSGVLRPTIEELFLGPSSVVTHVLGRGGASQILADHFGGRSRLAWIGFGATQELYARLLAEVRPTAG